MAKTPDLTKAIEAAVARALRVEVGRNVRELEKKILRLDNRIQRLKRASAKGVAPARPSPAPSPGRQLQGRYIGLLRTLTKKDQARVKSIRKKQGVEAAIREAASLRRQ
jgi:hypothetical protein